jgi:acetyl esterase/lipase
MLYEVEERVGFRDVAMYVPKTMEKRPGIVLLHGSEGGWSGWIHVTALKLAHAGFVAMPWPYSFGGNWAHAGDIHDISLDRTEAALAWLKNSAETSGRIGLYGHSRGAEHALLLVSLMAQDNSPSLPAAVAVHSPSDVVVGAFVANEWTPERLAQSPTGDTAEHETAPVDGASRFAWTWRGISDRAKPDSAIEIEQFAGPVFISHGEDDEIWPVDRTRRIEMRLRPAGREPEVHYYPGEGHTLSAAAENIQRPRLVDFFARTLPVA